MLGAQALRTKQSARHLNKRATLPNFIHPIRHFSQLINEQCSAPKLFVRNRSSGNTKFAVSKSDDIIVKVICHQGFACNFLIYTDGLLLHFSKGFMSERTKIADRNRSFLFVVYLL
ncbi:hypothetical protein Tcan_14535 [Toxocara canis]|uniref:Uncharacterized protein n=1 Tax=Toxocara canis TaxID=6265 RepID=A0A0B2USA0_TOXCA|nr:hypothetical protein Tcan_14535 [Toxocara canis]